MKLLIQGRLALAACVLGLGLLAGGALVSALGEAERGAKTQAAAREGRALEPEETLAMDRQARRDQSTGTGLALGGLAACVVAMALTQGVAGRLRGWLDEARDKQAGAKV